MASSRTSPVGGYWYAQAPDQTDGIQVLNGLRSYRAAEKAMRARMQDAMGMNDTTLAALRHLMQAQHENRFLRPKDLSRLLNISTASTTTLIDRLEASGHLARELHPTDRRALVLIPTANADTEVRRTFGLMHQRMLAVAQSLTTTEAETIRKFLQQMTAAIEPEDNPHSPD